MTHRQPSATVPTQAFFATEQQRLALARERFFEEGTRPSGLVSESVIQSWYRCLQARRDPNEAAGFNMVTRSRIHSALSRNRMFLNVAASEMMQLETLLAGTACHGMLTDVNGVVMHTTRSGSHHERLLHLANRVGVNLAEENVGTTAPGIVVRTGQPCTVRSAEHFFECLQVIQCAAAPIRDIHQQVAGVLNLSIEAPSFGFDAASMVALHATAIENRLLQAQSHEHIVVRLQAMPSLLGTPMEGLAGVDGAGRLAWVNGVAARLLGVPQVGPWTRLGEVFGLEIQALAALTRQTAATMHRLPSGLTIWWLAHMQSTDGAREVFNLGSPQSATQTTAEPEALATAPEETAPPTAPPAPARLRESELQLIERTLAGHGGNVSKAARALGVSRGLIYRHLSRPRPAPEGVLPPEAPRADAPSAGAGRPPA